MLHLHTHLLQRAVFPHSPTSGSKIAHPEKTMKYIYMHYSLHANFLGFNQHALLTINSTKRLNEKSVAVPKHLNICSLKKSPGHVFPVKFQSLPDADWDQIEYSVVVLDDMFPITP